MRRRQLRSECRKLIDDQAQSDAIDLLRLERWNYSRINQEALDTYAAGIALRTLYSTARS